MATGSGKTFTAVTEAYRLIKFANASRVLFLVDRGNLGRQALSEFQHYITPDDGSKFAGLYNVQLLTSNKIDPVARVVITTRYTLCLEMFYQFYEVSPTYKADAENSPAEDLAPILRATNINESLAFDDLVYVPEKYVNPDQLLQIGDMVVAASSGSRKLVEAVS